MTTQTKPDQILINYKSVMKILGCSDGAVRNLEKQGYLSSKYYPGLGKRWRLQDVKRYVREMGI